MSQQAVEKALKAVLISQGTDIPHTHNLLKLVEMLPQQYSSLPCLISATVLTDYAVSGRYPVENAPVDDNRYQRMIKLADDVITWA